MTYRTVDEAKHLQCPIARTFEQGKGEKCDGDACMLWRWERPMARGGSFEAAVKREMACMAQEDGKGRPHMSFHKKAVAKVSADLEGHGVRSDQGYCGLGGRP